MNWKELLYRKKIKQVDLAKLIKSDPSRVSLFINGAISVPKKYHQKLSEILDIPISEFSNTENKGESNETKT